MVFESLATDLDTSHPDTNGNRDVYIRDRDADGNGMFDDEGGVATLRVDFVSNCDEADGPTVTGRVVVSRNGRHVASVSLARNLTTFPADYDPTWTNVYVRDRGTCRVPAISRHPAPHTVCAGQSIVLETAAIGDPTLSYQWRRDGSDLADDDRISGANALTLIIDSIGTGDAGDYDCVVTNPCVCGEAWSRPAAVDVNPPAAATVTSALSRKACDLPLIIPGEGVQSEPRQGGISEVCIQFNSALACAGPGAVGVDEKTCADPVYRPYTGPSTPSCTAAGSTLCCTFSPPLENARTYRLTIGPGVTSVSGQFVEVRGLMGNVFDQDGLVNAVDRSVVVGVWTSTGFTCGTDVNNDSLTNAIDRSIVVGAWTGGQNCAP